MGKNDDSNSMQRDVMNTVSDADIDFLVEWTDSFTCNDPENDKIRSHLKRFVNAQLSQLSGAGLKSSAKLVELGCLRAATNLAWLQHVHEAECIFAGIGSMIQQGLTITEANADSALQNAIKVLQLRFRCVELGRLILPSHAFTGLCIDRS